MGSNPRSGRSPGGGHGNPLQYSCLKNAMDRGAWRVTVHSVTEMDTNEATQHAHRPCKWLRGPCVGQTYLVRSFPLAIPFNSSQDIACTQNTHQDSQIITGYQFPWRRKWQPTPVFLPRASCGQRSLVAAVHRVAQSQTRLKRLSSSSSFPMSNFGHTGG